MVCQDRRPGRLGQHPDTAVGLVVLGPIVSGSTNFGSGVYGTSGNDLAELLEDGEPRQRPGLMGIS